MKVHLAAVKECELTSLMLQRGKLSSHILTDNPTWEMFDSKLAAARLPASLFPARFLQQNHQAPNQRKRRRLHGKRNEKGLLNLHSSSQNNLRYNGGE
jgi:hypothetical protein